MNTYQTLCDQIALLRAERKQIEDHAGELQAKIENARGFLGAALMQSISSDDQIIMCRVREAFRELGGKP